MPSAFGAAVLGMALFGLAGANDSAEDLKRMEGTWEGTFIDPRGPNILIDLPPPILNWPSYVESGFDPKSHAAQNIEAAGAPELGFRGRLF